jgi:uncharacterized membrane protein
LDDVQVIRIDLMSRELQSGQFPVRWIHDLGNGGGYFLFNFYPPLAYYLGSFIHLIGVPLIKATKLTFLAGYITAFLGMFWFLRKYIEKEFAVLGAVLFVFSPFLNYEVYTRGALAEFFAFCLLPWFFAAYTRAIEERNNVWVFVAAVAYATIVVAHSFVGMALNFFIVPFVIYHRSVRTLARTAVAVILGLGLSSFFWLPSLVEQKFTSYSTSYFAQEAYKTNFLNPLAVFGITPPHWGFLPPAIGIGLSISAVIAAVYLLKKKDKSVWVYLSGFLISLLFVWGISRPIWDHISLIRYIQFPWRFLGFTSFFVTTLCMLGVVRVSNRVVRIILLLVVFLSVVILNSQYLHPKSYNFIGTYYAEDTCSTTTWAQEYMPKKVNCVTKRKDRSYTTPLVSVTKGVTLLNSREEENGRRLIFQAKGDQGIITVRRYLFPGFKVFDEKAKKTPITASKNHGLIQFPIEPGDHTYTVLLENTFVRAAGNGISIVSGCIVLLSLVYFGFRSKVGYNKHKS